MAEGLLRELAGTQFDISSAGSKPSTVNPFAIRAMRERGIDISHHYSKNLNEFIKQPFDYVITVCDNAAANCPMFPGNAEIMHISFPDPARATGPEEEIIAAFRRVRDDLRDKLIPLLRGRL